MKTKRVITLGHGRRVSVGNYVKAVKKAKANPDAMFNEGLTRWWPTSGADIVAEFREGVHARINAGVSYNVRGVAA